MSQQKRLLLDTHVFLWWRSDPAQIRGEAREVIANADVVFVSAASAWEAAIKASLGKLSIPAPFEAGVDASGFERLEVTFQHAAEVANLPWHHRDPFDRLLVAQALTEGLTLVTHDRSLAAYPIEALLT